MANKIYIQLEVDDKGTAVVRRFDKQTEQAFDKMRQNADRASTGMGGALQKLKQHWIAVTAAMAGVIAGLGKCVKAASDLQETTSKFEVVFADQIQRAEEFARVLVDSYAMSSRESKQFLSSIQDLLVPMGMQRDLAGQLSFEIVKLAADLGSFNNLPTAQVMANIQSALVGQYEAVRKYGASLTAATVEQRALELGLARTKEELTAAHKAYAGYTLLLDSSEAAIGDMARTQGSYANTLKRFGSATEDLAASIGTSLLPALTETFNWLDKIVRKYNEWVQAPDMIELEMQGLLRQRVEAEKQIEVLRERMAHNSAFADMLRMQGVSVGELTEQYRAEIQALEAYIETIDRSINEVNRLRMERARDETGGGGGGGGTGGGGGGPPPGPSDDVARSVIEAWEALNQRASEYGQLVMMDYQWAEEAWARERELLEEREAFLEAGRQAQLEAEWALQEEIQKGVQESYEHARSIEAQRTEMARRAAVTMLNNWMQAFAQLAEGSETAFALWKATAVAQTIVDTYAAAQAAYKAMAGIPVVGPALGAAAAAGAIAAGMARVSAIQSQTRETTYAHGGIVDSPTYFPMAGGKGLMGEQGPEAILPLARTPGGDLGVKTVGKSRQRSEVTIIMENPVFQDLATQRRVFADIATQVAERVAPGAVVRSYDNDGPIRARVRSRL